MSVPVEKAGKVGRIQPFDTSGVFRGDDGVLHYEGLHRSLVEMLRETCERVPDRDALIELDGGTLTFREYWDRSARVAGGLAAMGVERGDRVAIRLPNGNDWALAFFGSILAGAIVIPVNTRFAEPEIEYVLEDSGAKHVFMPGEPLPDGEPLALDDLGPDDVAAIFYTSGTTGQPKGAMTTHEAFLANIETVIRSSFQGVDETARMLISVPLFHVTGCNSQLLPQARLGGTTVIMPTFDIKQLMRAIEEHRTDAIVGTPAIFWLMLNRPEFADLDVSHVRWAVYGGAPMPPEQVLEMMEAFPNARLGNGYGMTETASVATLLPHDFCKDRPETVGFAVPNTEVQVEGGGSGPGELLIRSSQVTKG
jgi:long-chain acyl-CoA synthetase